MISRRDSGLEQEAASLHTSRALLEAPIRRRIFLHVGRIVGRVECPCKHSARSGRQARAIMYGILTNGQIRTSHKQYLNAS